MLVASKETFSDAITSECKYLTADVFKCWIFAGNTSVTWALASEMCSVLGGRLAVDSDADTQRALTQEVARFPRSDTWWTALRRDDVDYFTSTSGKRCDETACRMTTDRLIVVALFIYLQLL